MRETDEEVRTGARGGEGSVAVEFRGTFVQGLEMSGSPWFVACCGRG